MTTLIITLTLLAALLAIALAVSLKWKGGDQGDDYSSLLDQNGDHVYYDQSIIEKKRFRRLYPKEAVRTFAKLFQRRPFDKK